MALYAIDDLDDALDATRAFLLPFDLGRWLRLAVLAFFVAGGTGGGGFPTSGFQYGGGGPPGGPSGDVPIDQMMQAITGNLAVILAVVAVVVVVALVFAWLSATFEFAFLHALRTDEVAVREGVRRFSGKGTRLFAFRLVLGLVGFAIVAAALVLAFGPLLAGRGGVSVVAVLALLPLLVVIGVAFGLANAFTTAFVAPIMLLEDRGVVSAWRRLWPTIRREWKQFLAFAAVGFVLVIAVGIVVGIAVAAVGLALAIPFALLLVVVLAVGGGTGSFVVLGVVGAILGLLVLVAVALVQVPVQSYLRYWALLVLGDAHDEFDLIPDRRAEVRSAA